MVNYSKILLSLISISSIVSYSDFVSLVYLTDEVVDLVKDSNKSYEKRDICCQINSDNCNPCGDDGRWGEIHLKY
ncbi:hypothetical protein PIROE2DRAFT_12620 [Piromyces sp. E2]|nr:hypothetical protein PIROE2DRAFT_12620 [Piromyces sp. E2]|eukprot:OUM61370.1 hypothetical protein PIROE2DRAFT_12620 [Piromyces sp. E2]